MTGIAPGVVPAFRRRLEIELHCARGRVTVGLGVLVAVLGYLSDADQGSLGLDGGVDSGARGLLPILPLLLALPPALAVATDRELGMDDQGTLDGVGPWRGVLTAAAAAVLVALIAVGAALVAGAALGAADGILRAPVPGIQTYSGLSDLWRQLAIAVPFWLIGGAAIGAVLGARFAATAALAMLAVVALVLDRVGTELPAMAAVYALTPPGVIAVALGQGPDPPGILSDPILLDAVVLAWVVVAAAGLQRALTRRRAPGAVRAPGGQALLTRASVACGMGFVLAAGFVVPPALRASLPWYLRPVWLAEQAAGTASDDVARRFVDGVADGDARAPSRLVANADARAALGPYRPLLRPRPRLLEVRIEQSLDGAPGTVTLNTGPNRERGRQLTVCMVRRRGVWKVREIRSQPDC